MICAEARALPSVPSRVMAAWLPQPLALWRRPPVNQRHQIWFKRQNCFSIVSCGYFFTSAFVTPVFIFLFTPLFLFWKLFLISPSCFFYALYCNGLEQYMTVCTRTLFNENPCGALSIVRRFLAHEVNA